MTISCRFECPLTEARAQVIKGRNFTAAGDDAFEVSGAPGRRDLRDTNDLAVPVPRANAHARGIHVCFLAVPVNHKSQ